MFVSTFEKRFGWDEHQNTVYGADPVLSQGNFVAGWVDDCEHEWMCECQRHPDTAMLALYRGLRYTASTGAVCERYYSPLSDQSTPSI